MRTCPFCSNIDVTVVREEEWEREEGTAARERLYCHSCGAFWFSQPWLAFERLDDDMSDPDEPIDPAWSES